MHKKKEHKTLVVKSMGCVECLGYAFPPKHSMGEDHSRFVQYLKFKFLRTQIFSLLS